MKRKILLITAGLATALLLLLCCAALFASYSKMPKPLRPMPAVPDTGITTLDLSL